MRKPNLLFIYTDEQAYNTLACYGNQQIEMPYLNKFADSSCVFKQAYVTQPVCTPSRSTLLTGQWPHTNGCVANNIPLRQDTKCLTEMIPEGDYVSAHYGKWHLGDEIFIQHGFNHWRAIDDGYRGYYSEERDREQRSEYHHYLVDLGYEPTGDNGFNRNFCARLPEEHGKPAYLAQEASEFIRQHKDEPFILYVNIFEPHMPYFGPRDDQYDPNEIPLPENFEHIPGDDVPLKYRAFYERYLEAGCSMKLETEADWRKLRANYWGLCSLVDTHAGTILETLHECGLDDDTIVVYTSDHGDMMGAHHLTAKCVMYEEAVRVPFLLRVPGQRNQKMIDGPVSQIDIVPTLLDLMNYDIPSDVQGKSLKPYLSNDGESTVNEDIVIEWQNANTGIIGEYADRIIVPDAMKDSVSQEELIKSVIAPIRTIVTPDGWKFSWNANGENELYNLNDDPIEVNNLAFDDSYSSLMNSLKDKIRQWQKQHHDDERFVGFEI